MNYGGSEQGSFLWRAKGGSRRDFAPAPTRRDDMRYAKRSATEALTRLGALEKLLVAAGSPLTPGGVAR